jgi:C4-dicarboxylate-binding protein DctP
MTSKDFLDSLSAADREQFLAIADTVTQEANESVKAKEAANRANILKAGGKINTLTAEQRQTWVDTMKPVWKKFEGDIGKDVINAAAGA